MFQNIDGRLFDGSFFEETTFDPLSFFAPIVGATQRYEEVAALDQGWIMFSAPLARIAEFPAIRVELFGGNVEWIRSSNEPEDLKSFLRLRQGRLRKYETRLINADWEDTDYEELWRRYVEWRVAEWRRSAPVEARRIRATTLVRREFELPLPGAEPSLAVEEKDVYHWLWLERVPGEGPRL